MSNWGSCPKCGKPMQIHNMRVPISTWNGQSVCFNCEGKLRDLERFNERGDPSYRHNNGERR